MKNTLKLIITGLLSMILINCSSTSETTDAVETTINSANEEASEASATLSDSVFANEDQSEDYSMEDNSEKDEYNDDDYGNLKKSSISTIESGMASSSSFKNGFYRFPEACTMREDANDDSPSAGTISAQKRLWVEKYNQSWYKVFKKSGQVFIPASCLQI